MDRPESQLPEVEEEEGHRGTMVILMLYLVFIALLWSFAYFLLVSRGG